MEHERRIGPFAGRIGHARPVGAADPGARPVRHPVHEHALARTARSATCSAPSATSWCAASASAASLVEMDDARSQQELRGKQRNYALRAGGPAGRVAAADRAVPEPPPAVAAAQADEFFRPPVARRLRHPARPGGQRRTGTPGRPDGADAGGDQRPVRRHRPARGALPHHRHPGAGRGVPRAPGRRRSTSSATPSRTSRGYPGRAADAQPPPTHWSDIICPEDRRMQARTVQQAMRQRAARTRSNTASSTPTASSAGWPKAASRSATGPAARLWVDGIISDISERKHNEMRIEALLAEQSAILDNVMFGVMFVRERRMVSVNRRCEELFGYAHRRDGRRARPRSCSPTDAEFERGRPARSTRRWRAEQVLQRRAPVPARATAACSGAW